MVFSSEKEIKDGKPFLLKSVKFMASLQLC